MLPPSSSWTLPAARKKPPPAAGLERAQERARLEPLRLVRRQLAQHYDPNDLTTQNLSIYTSLDLHLQAIAQQAGISSVSIEISSEGAAAAPLMYR